MGERDAMMEQVKKVEKQMEKIKNAPKPVTVHLAEENFNSSRSTKYQNERLLSEIDYLQSHITKLTLQTRQQQDEVSALTNQERTMKRDLEEKQHEIDNMRNEQQRRMNEEKKRFVKEEEEMRREMDEKEKRMRGMRRDLEEKDRIIEELKKEIQENIKNHTFLLDKNTTSLQNL